MSFRIKIILLVTSLCLLMGGTLFGVAYKSMHIRFNESQSEWVGTVASALSSGINHDIDHKTPDRTTNQLVVAIQNDLAFEYAFVMDADTVFAHSFAGDVPAHLQSQTFPNDKIQPQMIELDQPDGLLHHYRFPLDTKGRSLHIGVNQKEINNLMATTVTDIAMALIPVTFFGLILGLLLSRSLNRELHELSKVMIQYRASGNLPEPRAGSGSPEIAEVIRQVEIMAAQQNTDIKNNQVTG